VRSLQRPKLWTIEDWTIGGLQLATGWKPEPRGIELACNGSEVKVGYPDFWGSICSKSSAPMPKMHGFRLVDLNNDGFLDVVVTSSLDLDTNDSFSSNLMQLKEIDLFELN
jgi:hypothetical protein